MNDTQIDRIRESLSIHLPRLQPQPWSDAEASQARDMLGRAHGHWTRITEQMPLTETDLLSLTSGWPELAAAIAQDSLSMLRAAELAKYAAMVQAFEEMTLDTMFAPFEVRWFEMLQEATRNLVPITYVASSLAQRRGAALPLHARLAVERAHQALGQLLEEAV